MDDYSGKKKRHDKDIDDLSEEELDDMDILDEEDVFDIDSGGLLEDDSELL